MPPRVASMLERFAAAIRTAFGARVREVRLFGSYARGEATEESDVDVLVVIDELTHEEHVRILDLAYRIDSAEEEFLGLSPLAYSTRHAADLRSRERRLLRDADRDGIPL